MERRGKRPAEDESDDDPVGKGHHITDKRMRAASSATGGPSAGGRVEDDDGGNVKESALSNRDKRRENDTRSKKESDEIKHVRFAMYHSGREFPYERLINDLGLKRFECAKDSHGNNYSTFTTDRQKRVSHVMRILRTFNQENPSKAIQIEGLGGGPPIITFDLRNPFHTNHVIRAIKEAGEKKRNGIEVFYRQWSVEIQKQIDENDDIEQEQEDNDVQQSVMQEDPSAFQCSGDQAVSSDSAKSTSKVSRLLEIDMNHSSFKPASTKRSCLVTLKPASIKEANISARKKYVNIRKEQVKPSTVTSSDSEHQQQDIPDPQPSADPVLHDDGGAISSGIPNQMSLTPLLPDENSMDSASSLSGVSSGSLSPSSKKVVRFIKKMEASKEKKLEKKLDMIYSSVNERGKSSDYLASSNERKDAELKRKDAELAAQKTKTRSAAGKTAAQTRKVNIAMEGERRALEEAENARAKEKAERKLREKADTEKSIMQITHAGMSTALANLSTANQIQDLGLKNGYIYLTEFASHLRNRKLTDGPHSRLKGVSPALPFSDLAIRRYYDHALAYADFKDASKSDNKHRLYLGLLGGPLYPESVMYHFRERLLDQIEDICSELGRPTPYSECEVDALLPPIQGLPFDIEEMKAWDFSAGRVRNADKIQELQRDFPNTEPQILWQYLVVLHRCNFRGKPTPEDSSTILKMLQGPMYNNNAFTSMETPLLSTLITLRSELQEKFPEKYWEHRHRWMKVVIQMQRARDSSHRDLDPDLGRANEYLVYARSVV